MTVLSHYPADGPPTVIAQHMPPAFLASFAQRLDKIIAPRVALALDGAIMEPGTVYLGAGGDHHVALADHDPMQLVLIPDDGAEAFVPSVNVLFSSAARHGSRIIGVMLTGMGRDGADAMKLMADQGAHNIVQDGKSCVVDGMPKAARAAGAATEVVPLGQIGSRILDQVSRPEREITA